jgi:transposase
MTYSFKKKRYCVRQALLGLTPKSEIARNRKVPRRTLYRWIKLYKQGGWEALENTKSPGAPETKINARFERIVVDFWKEHKYGNAKTHIILKQRGYEVSRRQIQKIFNKHGFRTNRRKRPSQIKYTRYERAFPNDLWHTDWTICPVTKKQLIAFIDDHSRYVVHAELFDTQTTENTLLASEKAISKGLGKPLCKYSQIMELSSHQQEEIMGRSQDGVKKEKYSTFLVGSLTRRLMVRLSDFSERTRRSVTSVSKR